jgi:hypothetical protein
MPASDLLGDQSQLALPTSGAPDERDVEVIGERLDALASWMFTVLSKLTRGRAKLATIFLTA